MSPNPLPVRCSSATMCSSISSSRPAGTSPPPLRYARHASVVIVNRLDGHAELGHLGEADPLPAEELATPSELSPKTKT